MEQKKGNIIVYGAGGRMGREVTRLLESNENRNCKLMAAIDIQGLPPASYPVGSTLDECPKGADCVIDFSHHSATRTLIDYAVNQHVALVIATTGHTPEELEWIKQAARTIPVFHSANMSLGVALLIELAQKTAQTFPEADIEIVEAHHNQKIDVPSGTALAIANGIRAVRPDHSFLVGRHEDGRRSNQEIGIHSLRMGTVIGVHEVIVHAGNQVITLKHEAVNRNLFAEGAISAAVWVSKQAPGLYHMNDMVQAVSTL